VDVVASAKALTGTPGTQVISAGPAVFRGLSLAETVGAVATVKVYDNATTGSGTLLGSYRAAAAGDRDVWLASGGLQAVNGITVVVTGTVEGSVRIG